jgi:hypothetical protein
MSTWIRSGEDSVLAASGSSFVEDPNHNTSKLTNQWGVPHLEHAVGRIPDARHHVGWGKGGLLHVLEVVAGVAVEVELAHLPTKSHRLNWQCIR